jgi:hypothetical protein
MHGKYRILVPAGEAEPRPAEARGGEPGRNRGLRGEGPAMRRIPMPCLRFHAMLVLLRKL